MRNHLKNNQKIFSILLVLVILAIYLTNIYSPYVEKLNEGNKAEQIYDASQSEDAVSEGIVGQVRAAANKTIELVMSEAVNTAQEQIEKHSSIENYGLSADEDEEDQAVIYEETSETEDFLNDTDESAADTDAIVNNTDELAADTDAIVNNTDESAADTDAIENNTDESAADTDASAKEVEIKYTFRNNGLWEEHFEKHGDEFPYDTKEEYLEGANLMLENPNKLHKLEKDDEDDVYYLEETNEFIIVSRDGYLRTYFKPSKGKQYFDRQ